MAQFGYLRRPTSVTHVGDIEIGGNNPIRLQSMNNTSTTDINASVAQAQRIADAGADLIRLTAQGVREAEAMGVIRHRMRDAGYTAPLVADIHFNPRAAFAAATQVEKVRINPGNFVDPGRTFTRLEYTDREYADELQKIDSALGPFFSLCKQHRTAVRIGVNHGSLSDRIMSRYGDTPEGMVESAMEFLRVAVRHDFTDIVISIKASNTVIMVQTVRMLVQAMDKEDMHFPLHLGVTEAGDGEDGRIRSAVGIGTLLMEGIGDTIRVSLSEDPEAELPEARRLVEHIGALSAIEPISGDYYPGFDPIKPIRRRSVAIGTVGGDNRPVVIGLDALDSVPVSQIALDDTTLSQRDEIAGESGNVLKLISSLPDAPYRIAAEIHRLTHYGSNAPVIACIDYGDMPHDDLIIAASADFGYLLLNGLIDGIDIRSVKMDQKSLHSLALGILQASRYRISKTEYISCPGCGRTLFDLQHTLHRVKSATSHLTGLKIGVMGCIVNGPGEMADADYGYVGAAAGHVSLYKGKECMRKNIPTDQAVDALIELIRASGDWKDPQ